MTLKRDLLHLTHWNHPLLTYGLYYRNAVSVMRMLLFTIVSVLEEERDSDGMKPSRIWPLRGFTPSECGSACCALRVEMLHHTWLLANC